MGHQIADLQWYFSLILFILVRSDQRYFIPINAHLITSFDLFMQLFVFY